MSVRILLADDHTIVRDGLRAVLACEPDLEVAGEADTGHQAIALAVTLNPDVVLMDIAMPGLNGVEATRQLLSINPAFKVIALSAHANKQFVLAMFEAGAVGYVIKASASDELLRAIRAVMNQRKYLSPEVTKAVFDDGLTQLPGQNGSVYEVLTPRERQVLQLLAEGKTSKLIAAALGISANTVEVHRRHIAKKLNLKSVAELTKYALREGLVTL